MVGTAINLYSVRELDEPLFDVLDRVADAGYDGVQISGGVAALGDATPGDVAAKLDAVGLDPVPPHVGMGELEDDRESVVEAFRDELGCAGVVIPAVDDEHFADAGRVDAFADRLDELAAALASADLGLHYHNHDFEFVDLGDETAYDRLVDRTDASMELDVGWAQVGGEDPVALVRDLGDQLDLVHMKDMHVADRAFAELGAGDVDVQGVADAARDVDADWLIYEHDDPPDPAASIVTGAEVLSSL
jgi:sugar phosphate isomerase/epimerase